MDSIRQYLLSLVVSAIICAIAKSVTSEKSFTGGITRLIAGIILTLTVLSPVMTINIADLPILTTDLTDEAAAAAAAGKEMASSEMNAIIIQQTQAYILDKAAAMGLTVQAEVILSEDHIPAAVRIRPEPEPQDKEALSRILTGDLGIPKENQQWSGSEQKKP